MLRPKPKTYPGIRIQNAMVGEVGFDYDAFMKSFFYGPQHESVPEFKFSVKKLGMIVIGEEREETKEEEEVQVIELNKCGVLVPPISNHSYLLDNRKMFLQTIRELVKTFKPIKDITCDNMQTSFALLPHQKLVSQYLKIDTPYRGLLFYHGLGSGKTCSAIAVAETLKPYKNIVVMTPKSLEMNFIQELKKCGDPLYAIHQKWEWVNPTAEQLKVRCMTEPMRQGGKSGLWVNGQGTDYADLSIENQKSIQAQIDLMIHAKYSFIIYNGNIIKFTKTNPFTNNVVIVDEAHNFVSKIINKLKQPDHPASILYKLMMEAENCKIVMLSGTPMINYPHEISVLFNMLRGYITTWSCKSVITEAEVRNEFPDADLVYRTSDIIHVTRSPHGFIRSDLSDPSVQNKNYDSSTFEERINAFFKDKGALIKKRYTAFPDNRDEFNEKFVDNGKLKNKTMLESRMVGLVSYFPDLKSLMPLLKPTTLHRVPMSNDQFAEYITVRHEEIKSAKKMRQRANMGAQDVGSNYRVQSRKICNTIYPSWVDKFRPANAKKDEEEDPDDIDVKSYQGFFDAIDKSDYCSNIQQYSPKYNTMIETIHTRKGLQLIYSQFLTIEGLRLFSRVLNSRGFAELDLISSSSGWSIRMPEKTSTPLYIIYAGTIAADKKELFRNIYNKNWDAVPESIRDQAKTLNIQLFMITASGAEGISLKNVQYVHIMEPYWNPVRAEQVIGRARRICSHNTLPEKDRFVEVNFYLSVLPDVELPEEIKTDLVGNAPGTTDEYLYRLSQNKRDLSDDILNCIRRSSIDCSLYGDDCLKMVTKDMDALTYYPNIELDITTDKDVALNVRPAFKALTKDGVTVYALEKMENGLYELYREKLVTEPIGFLSADKKTLYNKDHKVIRKLSEL